MYALTIPLLIGFALSLLIVGYFFLEARKNKDWERPKSILSEFVAVFTAISIGIWISGIERDLDRDEARKQRVDERLETAVALLQASIVYMNGTLEYLNTEQLSVTRDALTRPNIIDSLVSQHETFQRFSEEFGSISQEYLKFQRLSRAPIAECDASAEMYRAQTIDPNSNHAVGRWFLHIDEYGFSPGFRVVGLDADMTREERIRRYITLHDTHWCVLERLKLQVSQAYSLYEVLCLAAHTSEIEHSCDWTYISNDPSDRAAYDTAQQDWFRRVHQQGRFQPALDNNTIIQRYSSHADVLFTRMNAAADEPSTDKTDTD